MWHDLGTAIGWKGWLLMTLVMMAFWATVVVGLSVLIHFSWTTDRRKPEAPKFDGQSAELRRSRR